MRLGLHIGYWGAKRVDAVPLVREAERLGFDSVWTSEAWGSDAGTPFNPHGSAPFEIVRMVEWGMTPLRAMQAATSGAAQLLRLPDAGTVEAGRAADLVLYDANPIEQIEAVMKPAMVMRAGEVASGAAL